MFAAPLLLLLVVVLLLLLVLGDQWKVIGRATPAMSALDSSTRTTAVAFTTVTGVSGCCCRPLLLTARSTNGNGALPGALPFMSFRNREAVA
jgi:hypothetical protein